MKFDKEGRGSLEIGIQEQVFSASRAIEKHWPKKKSNLILVKIFFSLILVTKAGPCLHSLSYRITHMIISADVFYKMNSQKNPKELDCSDYHQEL